MPAKPLDHYATLGLSRRSTAAQIRAAYLALTKQFHPDVHPDSPEAGAKMRALNAAHDVLSDAARRSAYDRDLAAADAAQKTGERKIAGTQRNISHAVRLRLEDFLRGTALAVRVSDPANPRGPEIFHLEIPPETAPGARFRLPRAAPFAGGFVTVRVKAMPGFRFKAQGSNLRCDLRINAGMAASGGGENIPGITGAMVRVQVPPGVGRGAVLRVPGEGLPKARGGRGDLLVRITYRPEVRASRAARDPAQ